MEKKVDLKNQNLTWDDFEAKIAGLKDATEIDLTGNQIETITGSILALENLKSLNLSHNQLTEIPLVLFRMPNLETLVISLNRISEIPRQLKDSRIRHLIARIDRINEIDWSAFSNLTLLNLQGNQIKEMRLTIPLPKLEVLELGNNPVKMLDLDASNLPGLKKLHLYTRPEFISRVSKRLQPLFRQTGNLVGPLKMGELLDFMDEVSITIDLTKDFINLKEDELIHQTRYKEILRIIRDLMEKGQEYPKEKFRRVHNIITLSGSRGTGKTTLLLSVSKSMKTNNDFMEVLPLDVIDPTLIEEKGHIFLNVISMIKKLVENKNPDEYDSQKFQKWGMVLKDLAGGLPQLDGIQGGLDPGDWNDAQYVMYTGLKAVQSAIDLEFNFHEFVKLSLELLEKKFFILFFDDADNDFSKGWPVLETLRKYLTSPQLIILISGDLDLFSYLVRKKQWKNFGKELLKNEYDRDSDRQMLSAHNYPQMVEELESQYMVKLMSPRYRVTLDSVLAKLSRGEHIHVLSKSKAEPQPVQMFYQAYLTTFWGIQSKMALHDYVNLFLSLPIRSQIELMRAFNRVSDSLPPERASLNAAKALTDVFYSDLKSYEVDVWEMVNEYGEINIYILRFLLDTHLLDEGSQLYPKLSDVRLDSCVIALGCLLAERFNRRPYEIFDYIIRIAYPVSKSHWPMSGYLVEVDNKHFKRQSIDGLVDHAFLKYDYGMRKIASRESAYVLSFSDTNPYNEGLIPLNTLNRYAKEGKESKSMHIDLLFNSKDLSYTLAMIPTFAVRDSNHERGTYFSFYNLLAAIGQLLQNDITLIDKELHKLTTFRVYPSYYSHDEPGTDEESSYEDINQDVIVDETKYGPLVHHFKEWRKSLEANSIQLPPYVLGRAMVRTQSSFTRIDTAGHYVGTLFHRMLVVFLNAVLVEEQNERGSLQGMRLSNPVRSDNYLVGNIHAVFGPKFDANQDYFSYHLFRCPLILAYLDPKFIKDVGLTVPRYNIFEKLSQLKIKNADYPKWDLPTRVNRRVQPTQEDADRIVMLMKANNIKKDQVNKNSYMDYVRPIFLNKQRPNKKNEAALLGMIRTSDKW